LEFYDQVNYSEHPEAETGDVSLFRYEMNLGHPHPDPSFPFDLDHGFRRGRGLCLPWVFGWFIGRGGYFTLFLK
jgi:hypothetical protein